MSLLRRLSTRRYPHLLLSAGVCSYRSINPSATLLLSIDGTDRQTDRRTDARPLQGLCSAYYDDAQLFAYGYADILATDFMLLGSSFCWFTAQSTMSKAVVMVQGVLFYPIYHEDDFLRETFETICHAFHGWYLQEVMDGRIEQVFGMDATFGILHCVVRKFEYLQR